MMPSFWKPHDWLSSAMVSSGLLLAALAVVGAAAGDPRELVSGLTIGNITSGYSDQPNCLVRKDGAWLCTVTYNDKPEGSAGEHVITTISTDRGLTWSERYPVEPESKIQHAYSTLFQGPGDAVYVAYVENSDNVTTLDGDYAAREDMYGHFWLRRSLDGGKTWGGAAERWEIPVRETKIDRENSWRGKVRIMWAVDKGFECPKHGAFLAFAKVGTYVVDPPTEAWLLNSKNLATAEDPKDIEWTLLPEGDEGIHYWDPSAPGISEEGHVVPMDDGALYYVFRTDAGVLGGRASYDGGKTFADPTKTGAAVYADGSVVKNPRGPITPRAVDVLGGTTAYVLLYYNNGGKDFNGRNPYWLAPGWQSNGTDGATVVWGEPEVALFSTVAADRIGYPDFIVDAEEEALYISETEKVHCRMHKVPDAVLDLLLRQRDFAAKTPGAAATFGAVAAGATATQPAATVLDAGFAIAVRLAGALPSGTSVLFSTLKAATAADGGSVDGGLRLAKGLVQDTVTLDVGHLSPAHLEIPFRFVLDRQCAEKLAAPGAHFFAVSADPASRVLSAFVDGKLCDGGKYQTQGWVAMPTGADDPMQHALGAADATVGPALVGVDEVRFFDRYLKTTEMLGDYRAGLRAGL